MIPKKLMLLFLSVTFSTGCSPDRQSPESIPFIDVRKNYPEKEIVLTDIANVTYLHLNLKNDDFLYRGGINYATENTLVVADWSSNSILFFSKDGNPKSRFNRYGQGPEEYFHPDFSNMIYDEVTDDVYVPMRMSNIIQVYSSTGEYMRKLTLSYGVNSHISSIISFDDQSLLVYDRGNDYKKYLRYKAGDLSAFSPQLNDSSFLLISKLDGKLLEYVEMPSPVIDLTRISTTADGRSFPVWFNYPRIVKCTDGFLLCNPENDTICLYKKDKSCRFQDCIKGIHLCILQYVDN